jgi:hypothetical protein
MHRLAGLFWVSRGSFAGRLCNVYREDDVVEQRHQLLLEHLPSLRDADAVGDQLQHLRVRFRRNKLALKGAV